MAESLILVENASKKFCRNFKKSLRYGLLDITEELLGRRNGRGVLRPGEFWALKDVSFEVARNESIAILGRNGSGKSTLLKLICGKMKLDEGRIRVRARIAAVTELGAGFNPVQTGRENIYNAAAIYGMPYREADKLFEKIVDFSGLADFIDMPVKNYSSGMRARLGYSVAAHLDAEVLLIDEALAVGDLIFRRKCLQHLLEYKDKGRTLILVAHDLRMVQTISDRCILLHQGRVVFSGGVVEGFDLVQSDLLGSSQKKS